MKQILWLCILTSFLLCTSCSQKKFIPLYQDNKPLEQTALLITPIQVDLIYHNGNELHITPPYNPLVKYRLAPENHTLGFQYQDVHVNEDGNEEVITSKNTFIHFRAKQGERYMINYEKPENFDTAKKIEEKFQVKLTHNGQLVATSTFSAINSQKNSSITPVPTQALTEEQQGLQRLKLWWMNASELEKKHFTEWLKTH